MPRLNTMRETAAEPVKFFPHRLPSMSSAALRRKPCIPPLPDQRGCFMIAQLGQKTYALCLLAQPELSHCKEGHIGRGAAGIPRGEILVRANKGGHRLLEAVGPVLGHAQLAPVIEIIGLEAEGRLRLSEARDNPSGRALARLTTDQHCSLNQRVSSCHRFVIASALFRTSPFRLLSCSMRRTTSDLKPRVAWRR